VKVESDIVHKIIIEILILTTLSCTSLYHFVFINSTVYTIIFCILNYNANIIYKVKNVTYFKLHTIVFYIQNYILDI